MARLDLVHLILHDLGGQARPTAVDEVGKTVHNDSHEVRGGRRKHATQRAEATRREHSHPIFPRVGLNASDERRAPSRLERRHDSARPIERNHRAPPVAVAGELRINLDREGALEAQRLEGHGRTVTLVLADTAWTAGLASRDLPALPLPVSAASLPLLVQPLHRRRELIGIKQGLNDLDDAVGSKFPHDHCVVGPEIAPAAALARVFPSPHQ